MLDDKPMAVIPMACLVKVKSLTTFVSLSTSTDGLCLMDPLDGDQQLSVRNCSFSIDSSVSSREQCNLSISLTARSLRLQAVTKKWNSSHAQSLNLSQSYQGLSTLNRALTQNQVCAAARRLPCPIIPHSPAGQHS